MKYQRIPEIVEATQWFKLGDHPDVTLFPPGLWEDCDYCDYPVKEHGWFDDHWHESFLIHPGDWIVTDSSGTYVLSDKQFKEKYRPVE